LRSKLLPVVLALTVSGCKPLEPVHRFIDRLQLEWDALIAVSTGKRSPLMRPSPLASLNGALSTSQVNAELLREMYQVVFQRAPQDRTMFGSYLNTLNQGASLEGIYNGFTHSAFYRQLEMAHQGAAAPALKVFSEELARLEAETPSPAAFTEKAAQPLGRAMNPNVGLAAPLVVESPHASASPAVRSEAALAQEYTRVFVGASVFTLKRVLGDEALRIVSIKKEYREKLASWYGKWAVQLSEHKVDFGIALRSKPDETFHYQWALTASEDRVKWEVLNRLHRLLNEANREKP
jgi:hypothetical protein